MNINKLEQLVDQCIVGSINESELFKIFAYNRQKQLFEGEYIYLENIILDHFLFWLEMHFRQGEGIKDKKDFFHIKKILSGEKSYFFSSTLSMPSSDDKVPDRARWLLDLVHDSEWTTLRKLIRQYYDTRSIDFDIQYKYEKMVGSKRRKSETIIDVMKKIIYDGLSTTWWFKDFRGIEQFYPGRLYGKEANPLDYVNKLLRIIDCCEGKSFFIVVVNYLNGQPNISIVP